MNPVYITRLARFLPNEPVGNDQMEAVLGMVDGKPSRARSITLRNNGIKRRYYALKDGKATHTNAQMAALAVKALFDESHKMDDLDLLAAGTTSPDQLLPSHAAMVQGLLGGTDIEIMSASGACASSMQALKYAYMAVGSGLARMAAATGSERTSAWTKSDRFTGEADSWKEMDRNPYIAFEKDFLRWMLSDGAGAALLQSNKDDGKLALRIEWLEITSYAGEREACMYAGATKGEAGELTSWNDMPPQEMHGESALAYKQDTRLLGDNIVPLGGRFIAQLMRKRGITADDVDYYLPHMSSQFFKKQILEHHRRVGFDIPEEKWFYNLTEVGNVGSASPFLMLEELMRSGRLNKGDRLLMMVPESARFTYAYVYLTVV